MTVTVAAAVPFATVGPLAVIVVRVELGEPAIKFTLVGREAAGELTVRTLVSALVDFNEQKELPLASLTLQVPRTLFEPVAVSVGVSPAVTTPFFFTLIVIVEEAVPSAIIFEVADMEVAYELTGVAITPAPFWVFT